MDDERTTEYMKHTERELFRVFHVFRSRQQAALFVILGDSWSHERLWWMKKVRDSLQTLLFETAWGWCGAGLTIRGVSCLCLPYARPESALRRLRSLVEQCGGRMTAPAVPPVEEGPGPRSSLREWPHARTLVEEVRGYFDGRVRTFRARVDWLGATDFQRRVWRAARTIPWGQTRTYGELAGMAGSPRAARAVGQCMASNPVPLIVPCHRVIRSGGALGGFSAEGGEAFKKKLLEWESSRAYSR